MIVIGYKWSIGPPSWAIENDGTFNWANHDLQLATRYPSVMAAVRAMATEKFTKVDVENIRGGYFLAQVEETPRPSPIRVTSEVF